MERMMLGIDFFKDFRIEHRELREMLLKLKDSLESHNIIRSRNILDKINSVGGPHIRFEEEFLYPALKGFLGDYIDRFYRENDVLIDTVRAFSSLLEEEDLPEQVIKDSIDYVIMLFVHICNSEGLSLMCEKFSEDELDNLSAGWRFCVKEGIPLLEWADSIRVVRKAV